MSETATLSQKNQSSTRTYSTKTDAYFQKHHKILLPQISHDILNRLLQLHQHPEQQEEGNDVEYRNKGANHWWRTWLSRWTQTSHWKGNPWTQRSQNFTAEGPNLTKQQYDNHSNRHFKLNRLVLSLLWKYIHSSAEGLAQKAPFRGSKIKSAMPLKFKDNQQCLGRGPRKYTSSTAVRSRQLVHQDPTLRWRHFLTISIDMIVATGGLSNSHIHCPSSSYMYDWFY